MMNYVVHNLKGKEMLDCITNIIPNDVPTFLEKEPVKLSSPGTLEGLIAMVATRISSTEIGCSSPQKLFVESHWLY